jgi:hypothetical protein
VRPALRGEPGIACCWLFLTPAVAVLSCCCSSAAPAVAAPACSACCGEGQPVDTGSCRCHPAQLWSAMFAKPRVAGSYRPHVALTSQPCLMHLIFARCARAGASARPRTERSATAAPTSPQQTPTRWRVGVGRLAACSVQAWPWNSSLTSAPSHGGQQLQCPLDSFSIFPHASPAHHPPDGLHDCLHRASMCCQ